MLLFAEYANLILQIGVPLMVLLLVGEWIWSRKNKDIHIKTIDTFTSLGMGVANRITDYFVATFMVVGLGFLYQFRIFDLPTDALWVFVLGFFAEDFCYYWFHRGSHRIRYFWASHVNHHSSQYYNLATALRQSATGNLSGAFLFYAPAVLLGFHPGMILMFAAFSLCYQFWIHTESIDRMGWFEKIFNTPSHHRVHHATNPQYLDKNYAGILIIWDKLFGTFAEEGTRSEIKFGIVKNLDTYNLFWNLFHEWVGIFRDVRTAPDWKSALKYIFKEPGYSHDNSRETSETIYKNWLAKQKSTQNT